MTDAARGLTVGCSLALASGWNVANVGAVASDLAHASGVALATIGLLTSALFVTHTAIQVPGGRAVDRFGPVPSGAAALGLIVAGSLLCLASTGLALAIVGRLVTGIGTGLAFVAGSALVRESGGSAFAQGLFGGVGLGAGGLALAIVPQAERWVDWRAPYLTSLFLALLALALLLIMRRAGAPGARGGRPKAPVAAVLRDRRLYRLAVLYSCTYGVSVIMANWVVELLDRRGSMSSGAAGVIGGVTLFLAIGVRPLGGWVVRTHPELVRTVLAASLVAGSLGSVALLTAQPTAVAALGSLLVGFGAGMSFAPVFQGAALTRPDAPTTSVGLVNGVANLVVLVGTPLVGLGFAGGGDGHLAFAAIAALWLAALVVMPSRPTLGAAEAV